MVAICKTVYLKSYIIQGRSQEIIWGGGNPKNIYVLGTEKTEIRFLPPKAARIFLQPPKNYIPVLKLLLVQYYIICSLSKFGGGGLKPPYPPPPGYASVIKCMISDWFFFQLCFFFCRPYFVRSMISHDNHKAV